MNNIEFGSFVWFFCACILRMQALKNQAEDSAPTICYLGSMRWSIQQYLYEGEHFPHHNVMVKPLHWCDALPGAPIKLPSHFGPTTPFFFFFFSQSWPIKLQYTGVLRCMLESPLRTRGLDLDRPLWIYSKKKKTHTHTFRFQMCLHHLKQKPTMRKYMDLMDWSEGTRSKKDMKMKYHTSLEN